MMGFGKIGKKQRPGGYIPPGRGHTQSYSGAISAQIGKNWRSKRSSKIRKLLRLYENFIFEKCCYSKQITPSS